MAVVKHSPAIRKYTEKKKITRIDFQVSLKGEKLIVTVHK